MGSMITCLIVGLRMRVKFVNRSYVVQTNTRDYAECVIAYHSPVVFGGGRKWP